MPELIWRIFKLPLLLALTGGWLLTACQFSLSENQNQRINKLDSLLAGLEQSLNTVQKDSLAHYADHINEDLILLKKTFRDTTDTLFLTHDLPQYQEAVFLINDLVEKLEPLQKEVAFTQSQLEALKIDAENGKITPKQADQFLSEEEQLTLKLVERGDQFKSILQQAMSRYYSIQPKVEENL